MNDADAVLETTLIILAAIATAVYLGIKAFPSIRYHLAKRNSGNWPLAHATIETGTVVTDHSANGLQNLKYRCIFGYQYLVDSSRFSGSFAWDTITERRANQVRQQLMGLNVTAR